jgi:hypothetical protein
MWFENERKYRCPLSTLNLPVSLPITVSTLALKMKAT